VLTITRLLAAPRALVFQAFVDPRHALQWMGPRDHPVTHFEADVRRGGKWRACLRASIGGEELWQDGVYREIVPNERLAYTFAWDEEAGRRGPETLITITFEDRDGKTLMTFRQSVFDTTENRDSHRAGWNSSFDRLADYVARA